MTQACLHFYSNSDRFGVDRIYILPSRFHRTRRYRLLANGQREHNIARARDLLSLPQERSPASNTSTVRTMKRSHNHAPLQWPRDRH
jgi:hypothetical protein